MPLAWKRERIRHRFTRRERALRIYQRIYTAGPKGITNNRLARLERLSPSRIDFYIRLIRRLQKRRGIKIERRGRRFSYVNIAVKEEELLLQQPPATRAWELRGSVKYTEGHDLVLEIMILIPDMSRATRKRGVEQIKEALRDHNFGGLTDSEIEFGTIPATPQSKSYFWYKHAGDSERTVVW